MTDDHLRQCETVPLPNSEVPTRQLPSPTMEEETILAGSPVSDVGVVSGVLSEGIKPWVEQVRVKVFGTPEPPFSNRKAAIAWIEQPAAQQQAISLRTRKKAVALYHDARAALSHSARLLRCPCPDVSFPSPVYVPYVRAEGPTVRGVRDAHVHRAAAWVGSPLFRLGEEAAKISRATDFPEAHVVMHLLVGPHQSLRVPRSRVVIRRAISHVGIEPDRTGPSIRRTSATIYLLTPGAFTEPHVRRLVRQLRADLNLHKRKDLSARDQALLMLAKRTPRQFGERRKVYYQRLQDRWRARVEVLGPVPASPWKVKQAIQRVQERFEALTSG